LSSIRSQILGAAALAAALVLPAAAFAQTPAPLPPAPGAAVPGQPGRHGHHHGGGLRAALRGLNLTPAQSSQIQTLIAQTREANRNADPATRKANRQALRAKVEAILTPAQRTQLQAALKHRKRGA
jgi:Spy/CpxP family protein refolding chaperone